jgi:hypothetical protein
MYKRIRENTRIVSENKAFKLNAHYENYVIASDLIQWIYSIYAVNLLLSYSNSNF